MPSNRLTSAAFLMIATIALMVLLGAACAPAAPPTTAPAPTPAPAKPAPSKVEGPAPTAAPAKQESQPAAKPTGAPVASPAAKPAEQPVPKASPAARAAFDEKAVADFYKGKTIRIILGTAAGSGTDVTVRLLVAHISRYIPGNPTVVVENKGGAGGLLAANPVYNVERRDGTVIGNILEGLLLQQAIGADGLQFDARRFIWLGSMLKAAPACLARTDTGIKSVQDLMNGKELIVGTSGPGSVSNDAPAVMKATLGANFKLIQGYAGGAAALSAVEKKEIDGYCVSYTTFLTNAKHLLEGENPIARFIAILGSETPDHPLFKGVPAAEPLARTEQAKQLLRAVWAPSQMTIALAFPPDVPADRVQALRTAFDRTVVDPEFLEAVKKADVRVIPTSGQDVEPLVRAVLDSPPATLQQLKEILK